MLVFLELNNLNLNFSDEEIRVMIFSYPTLMGSPKIFNFWGERRHWALSTRQASSVRFNCRTRSWPTWNRTKIFRTKIWRNSLYTIGHRQNKLRELTCCASDALRLFFLLNQNEIWFSLWGFILLSFRKRVQRYCFFLIWPNFSAKKCNFSAFFCFLTSKSRSHLSPFRFHLSPLPFHFHNIVILFALLAK